MQHVSFSHVAPLAPASYNAYNIIKGNTAILRSKVQQDLLSNVITLVPMSALHDADDIINGTTEFL